jgi:hypothetical protein
MQSRSVAYLALSLLAAGCIGHNNVVGQRPSNEPPAPSPGPAPNPTGASPSLLGGIFQGTLTSTTNSTTQSVFAIDEPDTSFQFAAADCTFYYPTNNQLPIVNGQENGFTVTLTASQPFRCNNAAVTTVWSNGQTTESDSIVASFALAKSISGNYTTASDAGTFSMSYNPAYIRSATLSRVAGSYTSTGWTGTVDSHGALTATDGGGSYTGTVLPDPSDPTHDIYAVSILYAATGGGTSSFSGLGAVVDSATLKDGILLIEALDSVTGRSLVLVLSKA